MKHVLFVVVAFVCTRSALGHVAPVIAAHTPVVTAQSSQVFARNYNGIVPFAPVPVPLAPVPFAPVPLPAPFVPAVAPVPSRFVSPFLPPRLVGAYAPHVHPYLPYAPYPRPILY